MNTQNEKKLIYLYTATKEISWILLTKTIKLMLSRLLIRLPGTSIIFLNIEGMVKQIYPPELQLNKPNTTDTEAPFLDLLLQMDLFLLKFMINAMTLILI